MDIAAGRPDRRRALPARRARRVRPGRRDGGALRETARRAVQHRRRRPGAGRRGRRGGRPLRPDTAAARPAGVGARRGRRARPASRSSPRRSPTARTPRPAGSCRAPKPARCTHDEATVVAQAVSLVRDGVVHADRRHGGAGPGRVAVPARRHARRGGAGAGGAGRAGGARRGAGAVRADEAAALRRAGGAGRAGRPAARARSCGLPLAGEPGVVDAVAGARTVLVVFDPAVTSTRARPRRARSRRAACRGAARTRPDRWSVPVVYDGADLAEVAAECRLVAKSSDRPARRRRVHRALLRLLPRLRLPRRARPRGCTCRAARRRALPSRPVRWRSPASSPACTRARPPAAGSCSAAPTPTLWDVDARPARAARARHPGAVRAGMIEIVEPRPAGHGPGSRPDRLGRARRAPLRRVRPRRRAAGQPAGRQPGRRRRPRDHATAALPCARSTAATLALTGAACPGADFGVGVLGRRRARRCGSAFRPPAGCAATSRCAAGSPSTRCSARAAPTCSAGSGRRRCAPVTGCRSDARPRTQPSGATAPRTRLPRAACASRRARAPTGSRRTRSPC